MPEFIPDISIAEIETTNRLLADYLAGGAVVADFFGQAPGDLLGVAARRRTERGELAAVLGAFQRHLGADTAAERQAAALADPATPVITVGQQPGLLTGPCYTIYKTLTAINLARRVEAALGRPAVAVFWAATDDDDRAEVDHCAWWDRREALHALHYPAEAGMPGQLVGDLPVATAGMQVLAQALPLLEGWPYADETAHLLRETLAGSVDLGSWFCRLMARLFSPLGLVICDPRVPAIRRLGAEVIRREIAEPLRSTELVNAQAQALQARGYRPALRKAPELCNLFLLADDRRHRVTFDGARFHTDGEVVTPAEMRDVLAEEPERLLPNAVLRPVVQEYLFGSAAFVAGPNELGYWAELRPVFQALGVEMPPVIPRAAATLLPPAAVRALRDGEIAPLDLLTRGDDVRRELLARALPAELGQAFAEGTEAVARVTARVSEALGRLDPTLVPSMLATQQKMLRELARLERKAANTAERRGGEITERLEMLQSVLFPRRAPQERTLNIFPVLARHGCGLIERLRCRLDGKEGRHIFVELTEI